MAADPHALAEALRLPAGVEIRPLAARAELEACVDLQRRVWGPGFADVASPAVLKIVQNVGGVAAGAFDAGGALLGFVFGVTGLADGQQRALIHWSHMLAVLPEARGRDLGYHLKLYQRRRLLDLGVESALWTFDPLVAKNAHLNLVRLGARAVRYARDYYGEGSDSALSAGIGTDRFVVEWRLADERVARRLERAGPGPELSPEHAAAPVANVRPAGGEAVVAQPPSAPVVRVEVPDDILGVRRRSPEQAARWRGSTRQAFEALLDRGYRVETFYREGAGEGARAFYVLRKEGGA
jgi:predicted GNAT superfamily acetyltransferase